MRVEFDFAAVLSEWPFLLKGVYWTLGLTAISTILGVSLGVVFARLKLKGSGVTRFIVSAYVEVIRNTPFIVQLFFIFFGLPALGLKLSPEWASVLAMVINLSAYSTEIIRAGIEATPISQLEAAKSLALSERHIFSRVVLPQALERIWPALVSQIVIVMLGSAVCGQISTQELSYAANVIQSRNFRAFEAFIVATSIYLALSIALRWSLNRIGPLFLFGTRRG